MNVYQICGNEQSDHPHLYVYAEDVAAALRYFRSRPLATSEGGPIRRISFQRALELCPVTVYGTDGRPKDQSLVTLVLLGEKTAKERLYWLRLERTHLEAELRELNETIARVEERLDQGDT